MKLIIYMPALDEEENIQRAIAGLPQTVSGIDIIQTLVIDDGSTDKTAELALAENTQVISHKRNRGVGAAFHSAVQFALENDADILVGIDADGQFDPLEIPDLISPILCNKADMVIGNRFIYGKPENMPTVKYWGNNQVSKLISTVCNQDFQDVSCGYRAYSREALLRLNLFAEFTYTHETILSLVYQGLRVVDQPIRVKYYPERKSRVAGSLANYAAQTSKIILRVVLDYRPLRIFGTIGIILMLIGLGFELFLFGHYATTQSFTPYKSYGFIGLGFFTFGLLVLLIALISDMLNRLRTNQDKILYELKKLNYEN